MEMISFQGTYCNTLWCDGRTRAATCSVLTKEKFPKEEFARGVNVKKNPLTDKNEHVSVVYCNGMQAHIPDFRKKEPVMVTGYFREEETYGYELVVKSMKDVSTDDLEAVDFLVEAFKLDFSDASAIVSKYGPDIYSLCWGDDAIEKINQACDLPCEKIEAIVDSMRQLMAEHTLFNVLSPDVSYATCVKVAKKYGKRALNELYDNPYKFGETYNVPFKRVDKIACEAGVKENSPMRVEYLVNYAIEHFTESGSTYMSTEEFKKAMDRYGERSFMASCALLSRRAPSICLHGEVLVVNQHLINAEKRAAQNYERLQKSGKVMIEHYSPSMLDPIEEQIGFQLGTQQANAMKTLLSNRSVKVLTGGPGTGKTTIIKAVITAYRQMHPDHVIRLCAPTGRAAQRMTEATGMEAVTIHRLLNYRPYGDTETCKDEEDPIQADFIVVDEASMIDVELFDKFLRAVRTGTELILVGDVNQLPPVGAGQVLNDLLSLEYDRPNSAILSEIYRQGEESSIVQNAYRILDDNTDMIQDDDFQVINTMTSQETLSKMVETVKKYYDPDDKFACQVLCPSWKGDAGVHRINEILQKLLNPGNSGMRYGHASYRPGDKVLLTRNNYGDPTYYNGDLGIVSSYSEDSLNIKLPDKEIQLSQDLLDDVSLAYGMTIHKSQGSEFKTVVIVLSSEFDSMLVRNLIYTAVTRASQRVIIINEGDALDVAIHTASKERKTTFKAYVEQTYRGIKYQIA